MNGYAVKLSSLRLSVEKPGRVYLRHPGTGEFLATKDGVKAYVDVMSRDSPDYERRVRDIVETRARRVADGLKPNPDQDAIDGAVTAALMTKGWFHVSASGEIVDLPCSYDAALEIYSDPGFTWLVLQVLAGSGDRSLFMPGRSEG